LVNTTGGIARAPSSPLRRRRRIISRAMPRSRCMPPTLLALLLACPLALAARPGPGYAPLVAALKAIGTAANDAARDSANAAVKHELGSILDSDSAFTATFAQVPISRVDAPDGSFRLFTWNLPMDDGSF